MPKNEPNAKDRTDTGMFTQDMKDFITDLRADISKDDNDRSTWKTKMVTAGNQRMGVKQYTDWPYPGAPDIPLPETDKLIKNSIPNLVMSAWSPKKLCNVRIKEGIKNTPELVQKAARAEAAMNQRLRSKDMDWLHKLMLAADNMKHYGHCIFRLYEDFKTNIVTNTVDLEDIPQQMLEEMKLLDNNGKKLMASDYFGLDLEADAELIDDIVKQFNEGKETIECQKEVISSMPNVEVCLPTKIIVPSYTTSINKAQRITYEMFMTRPEIEEAIDNEVFRKIDIETLEASGLSKDDSQDIVEQQKERNEGVESSGERKDIYKIHIVNTWYRPEESEPYQKWVFVFLADVMDPEEGTLYSKPFHFEWEGWDYEKCDNETMDPRYFSSRGVPEQIRALQEVMEKSVNNMLIRDEMNNCPMWEVMSTSEIMDSSISFGPMEKLPVTQIGSEIKKLNENISVDLSSERIMSLIKATAEEYQHSTDQLFRNSTNAGGGKTLGEIQEGIRQNTGPITLDISNFNDCLSRVYTKMFLIFADRLGESIWVDDMEVTKEDFQIPAYVTSNGNLEVSDQRLAAQKSFARLQILTQLMPLGVLNQEDLYNAAKDWLEKDGIKDPDMFLTDPKEIMQTQVAQLQQQVQQLQQYVEAGNKEVEKLQKSIGRNRTKIDKDIANAEGELQALEEEKRER